MTGLPEAIQVRRLFQLLLVTASTFAATYGRFTLGPLQETMRISLPLSDNQVAWLQGPAMAIPMALGSIPIGLLVDRYSRARLFIAFAFLSLAATAMTAFAPSMILLFVARCLAGFASAATLIAAFSVVGDLYAPAQRGRATMVALFGEIGGAPAAFALGGVLLATTSATTSFGLMDWRSTLLWMCAPFVPVILLLFMLREPVRTGLTVKNPSLRQVWPQFFSHRTVVVPLLLARIMVWIADGAVLVWAAPSFARSFGLRSDRIGVIIATAFLASGILGPILGGALSDLCQRRGGPRRTMKAMCIIALLSSPAALFATMPNVTLAGFMLSAFLTLGFTIGTAALAVATIVIPGELRGLYVAVTVTVGAVFSVGVAPLIVSSLSGSLGGPAEVGRALAIVCGVTSILGAVVFGAGSRYFPHSGHDASCRG